MSLFAEQVLAADGGHAADPELAAPPPGGAPERRGGAGHYHRPTRRRGLDAVHLPVREGVPTPTAVRAVCAARQHPQDQLQAAGYGSIPHASETFNAGRGRVLLLSIRV